MVPMGADRLLTIVGAGLVIPLGIHFAIMEKVQEPFHADIDSAGATSFYCENVNGSLRLNTWQSSSTKVDAIKEAPTAEMLNKIHINVGREGGEIKIATHFNGQNTAGLAVHYDISLPVFIGSLSLRAVNADLEATGFDAKIIIRLGNGQVNLSQENGSADIQVTNGKISLSLKKTHRRFSSSLESVNGDIRLSLRKDAHCTIDARVENGEIVNGLPLSVQEQTKKVLRGRMGLGGHLISLRLVNGKVELCKPPE